MLSLHIYAQPQFSIKFRMPDILLISQCAKYHYSDDVKTLISECKSDKPGSRNGLCTIARFHMTFDKVQTYDATLTFREVDLILKALEMYPQIAGLGDGSMRSVHDQMQALFTKALAESSALLANWRKEVSI